jgi:phosphoglycolate phosphatase-like HAD superfamily hydrolase
MGAIGVTWGAGLPADLEAAGPDSLVDSAEELSRALLEVGSPLSAR